MSKKILVLGHKGMLGNVVTSFLSQQKDINVVTIQSRWGDIDFTDEILNHKPDYIINCIGSIPQKKPTPDIYTKVNFELPLFLEGLHIRTIHPTTDCEFSGDLPIDKKYSREDLRDATDYYGKSKAMISELAEKEFKHTKLIRTSIIGHELESHYSFLDWFLSSENEVNGYADHYWNGITTLAWAEISLAIISDWESYPRLNQYGTDKALSKYEILQLIQKVYNKNIKINPVITGKIVNKCLISDDNLPPLEEQLKELKRFYNK
jgi:dTDP-4-dehydrorhamnose reductase